MTDGGRVDSGARGCIVNRMSLAEIKSAIDRLTREELDAVSAHLRERRWLEDSPARRAELAEIRDEMEQGRRHTLAELKQRHDELLAEGK